MGWFLDTNAIFQQLGKILKEIYSVYGSVNLRPGEGPLVKPQEYQYVAPYGRKQMSVFFQSHKWSSRGSTLVAMSTLRHFSRSLTPNTEVCTLVAVAVGCFAAECRKMNPRFPG